MRFFLIFFAVGILFIPPIFAETESVKTTTENETEILHSVPTGVKIIEFGMFDAEDDGNLVHQLVVGEKYWFEIVHQNELEASHDLMVSVQLIDKNKIENNVLKKIDGHGVQEPQEIMGDGFGWTPEYSGQFKITAEVTSLDDPLVGVIAPQYDLVVVDRPALKQQIKNTIPINDIICRDKDHYLVERTNGKLACVTFDTAEKLGWKSIKPYVIILDQSMKESLLNRYRDLPEVAALYEKYDDAQASVREDHISYFAGNEDDFLVRMNVYFDENFDLDYMDFHCYVDRVHQDDVAQTFILKYLEKFDCKK